MQRVGLYFRLSSLVWAKAAFFRWNLEASTVPVSLESAFAPAPSEALKVCPEFIHGVLLPDPPRLESLWRVHFFSCIPLFLALLNQLFQAVSSFPVCPAELSIFLFNPLGFPSGSAIKNLLAMQETQMWVGSLG